MPQHSVVACKRIFQNQGFTESVPYMEYSKSQETSKMDEASLEEYRPLIRQRNERNRLQRFKENCIKVPSRRTIGIGILICASISIVALLTLHRISHDNELSLDVPVVMDQEDEMYSFNGTDEITMFLQEWKNGEALLKNQRKQQADLYNKVLPQRLKKRPTYVELYFSGNETSLQLFDCELILEHVKRKLKKCVSIDILPEECLNMLQDTVQCDPKYPYRNINGSCNNLVNPSWGQSGQEYLRLLKPHYADDVSAPPLSVYGVELPNPRLLSIRIFNTKLLPDAETTMLFMNYGLFVDHDFIKSLLPSKDIIMDCCEPEVIADPRLRHPGCWEVLVPLSDSFYIDKNITCLNFFRSIPVIGKCPGRREQSNTMTAYLDLSATYGPTDEETKKLRSFEGGKLLYSKIGDTPVLPFDNETGSTCYQRDAKYKCFISGDTRVNMHLEAMAMHTIWLREHNRLAEELQMINPHWSDEKIFQEARRINIAEFQHITYNEWLPNVFGKQRMKEYGLEINPKEDYDGYDETVQAGIYNSFSTAAFRFGHSLVQDVMEFRGPDFKLRSIVPLHKTYTNPSVIYRKGMDDIIRGMAFQRTFRPERHTTLEVRNRLFQRYYSDHGLDLTMMTIQRGRDRGLPSYTKWRKFCGLQEILSWDDMYKIMYKIRVDELREMYMSVHDVELITGALSEYHLEGALVGPTYACIIRRQLRNARIADRFWYENRRQAGSFTHGQLKEIYKSNFARILCDTSDELEKIQVSPLLINSTRNPMVSCDKLPNIDLSFWKDDLKK